MLMSLNKCRPLHLFSHLLLNGVDIGGSLIVRFVIKFTSLANLSLFNAPPAPPFSFSTCELGGFSNPPQEPAFFVLTSLKTCPDINSSPRRPNRQ